jgi:prepilin-type N-terminal cleavage/methylation domain-containing protein
MVYFGVNKKGSSLIEIIIVISILSIMATVAVSAFNGYVETARREVCRINLKQLEIMYGTYLTLESVDHAEVVFAQYMEGYAERICPNNGDITYVDGRIRCSLHAGGDEEEEQEVPYL